jgi:hypothetical protein
LDFLRIAAADFNLASSFKLDFSIGFAIGSSGIIDCFNFVIFSNDDFRSNLAAAVIAKKRALSHICAASVANLIFD